MKTLKERLQTLADLLHTLNEPRLAEDVFLASARISLLEREMGRKTDPSGDLRQKLAQLKRLGYLEGLEAAAKIAEAAGSVMVARDIRGLRREGDAA